MKEKLVGITVHIPEKINEKLKVIAQEESRAVKNLLRLVIQQYVNNQENKKRQMIITDQMKGLIE